MNTRDIENKIKAFKLKLPDYTEETAESVKQWENELSAIERIETISRNPVILELVSDYSREVEAINYRLTNEEGIDEKERHELFANKRACQRFINTFDIEGNKEVLYKVISNELK